MKFFPPYKDEGEFVAYFWPGPLDQVPGWQNGARGWLGCKPGRSEGVDVAVLARGRGSMFSKWGNL